MANVKISGLTSAAAASGTQELEVNDSGTSKKITGSQLLTYVQNNISVGTTAIANDAVTYAKIQNVSATDKLLGRATAGAGDVEEITCTSFARTLLDDADAATARATLGVSTLSIASRSDVNGVHTTGTITSGTTSMTVASGTGIVTGMIVTGEGITPGTTVSNVSGTSVTLSANAGTTLSSDPVGFYDNTKALSPGSVGGQLCRAWVNFNGTGTVAIRASFNVSSITDNGTGDYTVNFTTALPDSNYATTSSISFDLASAGGSFTIFEVTAQTTSTVRLFSQANTGVAADSQYIAVSIFR